MLQLTVPFAIFIFYSSSMFLLIFFTTLLFRHTSKDGFVRFATATRKKSDSIREWITWVESYDHQRGHFANCELESLTMRDEAVFVSSNLCLLILSFKLNPFWLKNYERCEVLKLLRVKIFENANNPVFPRIVCDSEQVI